jgi:hypothetical protein
MVEVMTEDETTDAKVTVTVRRERDGYRAIIKSGKHWFGGAGGTVLAALEGAVQTARSEKKGKGRPTDRYLAAKRLGG